MARRKKHEIEAEQREEMFLEASIASLHGVDVDTLYSEKYPNVVRQLDPRMADNGEDWTYEEVLELDQLAKRVWREEDEKQAEWESIRLNDINALSPQPCHICGKPTTSTCFCCGRPVCYEECSTIELMDMTLQTEGNFCNACWGDMEQALGKGVAQ